MAHLKKGEAGKLFRYLADKWTERAIESMQDCAYLKDSVSMISHLDQLGAKIKEDYERESSFGRNKTQIRRKAREHMRRCHHCYTEYEVVVKNIALGASRAQRTVLENLGKPLTIKEINSALEETIKEMDVFGILGKK